MDDNNALIAELTELALTTAAPDELVVFEETAQEYFADPEAALSASGRDEAVGFGLELAMITPVALAVGSLVVQTIASHLAGRAITAGERGVVALARRAFRREAAPVDLALTPKQAQHVRYVAWERARALGLPDSQAQLLADSFVGAIAVGG
ncbi:MAG TPA: hypothetical protein DGG94_11820 [Micromonosporaceae bacterium]|nr:hypothetical protein [Micromonosporaceae bacterium]HCU50468.1 hypothetical protein [Micromonosporaceae bacterium]